MGLGKDMVKCENAAYKDLRFRIIYIDINYPDGIMFAIKLVLNELLASLCRLA